MLLGKESEFDECPHFSIDAQLRSRTGPLHTGLLPDEAIHTGKVDYIPSGQSLWI